MLHSTKLDFKFWGELLLTAAYTYNVTGHSSIELKSPHEVLFGEDPNLNHLRTIDGSNSTRNQAILLGYILFYI